MPKLTGNDLPVLRLSQAMSDPIKVINRPVRKLPHLLLFKSVKERMIIIKPITVAVIPIMVKKLTKFIVYISALKFYTTIASGEVHQQPSFDFIELGGAAQMFIDGQRLIA
jgi:hypothetical protein